MKKLLYQHKISAGEEVIHTKAVKYSGDKRIIKRIHRFNMVIGISVTAIVFVLVFLLCSGLLKPKLEYGGNIEVTAHRGACALYPENTMSAFVGAKELSADWIELDVQQCRDGEIIVIHDSNFYRTTGVDANTWELTYKEIEGFDAGSFFDEEFAGEKIPRLKDVVLFAKENGIRLNIELKPTGHETDFEKAVVDIICGADYAESCVLTSQVYQVLENVKNYNEAITTVYVMSLAYGDIDRMIAADHFSVEATSATYDLVSRVHRANKQIFAWTVNTEESILRMIDRGVDNIITDDVELARRCIRQSRYSDFLHWYLELFGIGSE